MKTSIVVAIGALSWCLSCDVSWAQQATGTAGTEAEGTNSSSVAPATAAAGTANPSESPGPSSVTNSPGNPSAGQGIGTNNVNTATPNPSIAPTTPNQPAAGNQPLSGAQPGQTGSMESQRLNSLNRSYQSQQQRALSAEQQRLNGPMQTGISGSGRVVDRQSAAADLRRLGLATEDWRIVNQNGRWWFWTPNKSWMYFDNGSWRDYRANNLGLATSGDRRTVTFPPGYAPEDWRLVFHANRWWFWTPNESWMYFDRGRWNDYRASGSVVTRGQAENQYRVGYRGSNAGSTSPSTVQVPATNNDSAVESNAVSPRQTVPPMDANPNKSQDQAGPNDDAHE